MTQASGLPLGDNRNINGLTKLFIVLSEKFAKPALEAITTNGITDLATYRYTETRNIPPRIHNHSKMGGMITSSLLPGLLILT